MTPRFHNRTRRSASIPRTLLSRGRVLELPLYYALRLSDLAREGLEHSGSHRFADHIYRNEPSGTGAIGRWLDARLLALPAVRSFRSRYLTARDEVARVVLERLRMHDDTAIRVLSVPCGIPRELADAADEVRREHGVLPDRVEFHGIDLDAGVLDEARAFARARGLRGFRTHQGDALSASTYPDGLACITCTGLAEFLDDEELVQLYGVCFRALAPGGLFITSGMRWRWLSDYLLRLAEIRTHYRAAEDLSRLARRLPFREVRVHADSVGLQTILTATA
jgi:SAM-dependent methyltransferase